MNVPVKSNELRVRLNNLDQMLARGGVRSNARPIPAKVFEGDDVIFGSRN